MSTENKDTMKKLSLSLPQVRQTERQLFYQALRFVAGNFFNSQIRNTRHFREWFRKPMNYARIMELPIAVLLLKAEKNDIILDVSSPKFLALYYAIKGFNRVVAADLETIS